MGGRRLLLTDGVPLDNAFALSALALALVALTILVATLHFLRKHRLQQSGSSIQKQQSPSLLWMMYGGMQLPIHAEEDTSQPLNHGENVMTFHISAAAGCTMLPSPCTSCPLASVKSTPPPPLVLEAGHGAFGSAAGCYAASAALAEVQKPPRRYCRRQR